MKQNLHRKRLCSLEFCYADNQTKLLSTLITFPLLLRDSGTSLALLILKSPNKTNSMWYKTPSGHNQYNKQIIQN